MDIQKAVQHIEKKGIKLDVDNDKLNITSRAKLRDDQLFFLKTHKQEIIDFLNYRKSIDKQIIEDIQCPDTTIKQNLMYEYVCRKHKLKPEKWENNAKRDKLMIFNEVFCLHKALLAQCENCSQNANNEVSAYDCLSFGSVQEVAIYWDPILVDWKKCPFFEPLEK